VRRIHFRLPFDGIAIYRTLPKALLKLPIRWLSFSLAIRDFPSVLSDGSRVEEEENAC
jgi:hypothetical protein